jgi:pimeloyl-ACP methyl ester carboxylesterase
MRAALAIAAMLALAVPGVARADLLPPHKDELFSYPGYLSTADGGDYRVVAYVEKRDLDGRDEVPERRVKPNYVSLGVRNQQQQLALQTGNGNIPHYAVGRTEGASLIVVYLHGQGGSMRQGVDDFTFGGNFNRIKNLAAAAGGLYLSPGFSNFDDAGASQVRALIRHYAGLSPKAEVYIACGSMGGRLCWRMADDSAVAPRLGGLLMLGSMWNDDFFRSAAFKRRVPVFFGQGTRDAVFTVDNVAAFYRKIRARAQGYPVRMVVFDDGSHGTPIRMTDWRETINWMARQ